MFCPKCGGSVNEGIKFCPACGAGMSPGGAAPASAPPAAGSAPAAPPAQFKNPLADLPQAALPTVDQFKQYQTLNWTWVGIGAVVMVVLAQVVTNLLFNLMFNNPGMLFSGGAEFIIYGGLALSFAAGGFLVGWKSPGVAIREAAVAGAAAVLVSALLTRGAFGNLGGLVISLAIGFFAALVGGWLGERFQLKEQSGKK